MQVLGWFFIKKLSRTHSTPPPTPETHNSGSLSTATYTTGTGTHSSSAYQQTDTTPTKKTPYTQKPPHHTIPNKQNHNRIPSPHTADRTNPQSQPLSPRNSYTNQRAPQTPSTHPRRTRRVEDATCKPLIDLKRRNSPIAGRLQRRCEWVPRCRFSWQSASSPIWGAFLSAGFLLRDGVHKGSGVWNYPVRTVPHPAWRVIWVSCRTPAGKVASSSQC